MLDVKTRQKYLKELGFYTGEIDGSAGPLTRAAYKKLQEQYFTRTSDIDGLYGNNTDTLLQNAYNFIGSKYFKLSEFKCGCKGKYCTGYPAVIDKTFLDNLNKLREYFGKPVNITSGMRCKPYNSSLKGSSAVSKHLHGKAADFYISTQTSTLRGRREVMAYWKKLPKYGYTYCNEGGNYPNMGSAVHVDTK